MARPIANTPVLKSNVAKQMLFDKLVAHRAFWSYDPKSLKLPDISDELLIS